MRWKTTSTISMLATGLVTLVACGGGSGSADPTVTTAAQSTTKRRTTDEATGAPTSTGATSRNNGVSLGLDISDLSFAAVSASRSTPPQQVLVYFDDYAGNLVGDVYVHLTLSGAAVANSSRAVAKLSIDAAGNVTAGPDATMSMLRDAGGPRLVGTTIRIEPKAPAKLGTGKFWGTAIVRACLGDSTCATGELPGSPRTISIAYDIAPATNAGVPASDETAFLARRQAER